MAETDSKSAAVPQPVPSRDAVEIIVASATEALGSAFLLSILGGVAISIAGSFAGQMVPSPPPGFGGPQTGHHHAWRHPLQSYAFGFCFAVFFVHSLWAGFHGKGSPASRRLERILSNLRENWFGLIVGNAISAWVAILILSVVPSFSPLNMLWHWLWGMIVPFVHETGTFVLGESKTASVNDWFSWYGDNHMKLNFWIIYLAGAFDDLGVPNFKTLAWWGWRRIQKRKCATVPVSTDRGEVA